MSGRDQWQDTRNAARVLATVAGTVAIVCLIVEAGARIATVGVGGWVDRPISGTDFVLAIIVVFGGLSVAAIGAFEGAAILAEGRRKRRAHRADIKEHWAEDEAARERHRRSLEP